MPRPPALTAAQEKLLRAKVRVGANKPALLHYAKEKGIKLSPTKAGELITSERGRSAERAPAPATDAPAEPAALLERVATLQQAVDSLRGRMDALVQVPKVKLSESLNAAAWWAQQMLGDPAVDASAKARIMAQLPDLAEAVRKAVEAEQGGGDEELGE